MNANLCFFIALCTRLFAGSPSDDEFVVHEWGTFTSVQGADGVQIEWNPIIKTDLPKFVYSRVFLPISSRSVSGAIAFKDAMPSFVRMETPVVYFYSQHEITADVRVDMPQGRITEWYPRATRLGPYTTTNKADAQAGRPFIEWTDLRILARDTTEISAESLIREKNGSHYYEARETDANFVRAASPHEKSGAEYERDLFYRGVGFFKAPLVLQLEDDENQLRLSTKSPTPLTDLFVLTIRRGMARCQYVERVSKESGADVSLTSKPFTPLTDVRSQVMRDMMTALTKQGLYEKEARAMVKTWEDQWFTEEGTRVLYLLPRPWTDETLPLTISPAPRQLVRVMVGRAELITPSAELTLKNEVERYASGTTSEQREAIAEVRGLALGRFLEPATRKMLGKNPSKEMSQAAWKLAQEASKPVSEKRAALQPAKLGKSSEHLAAQ